MKKTIIFLTSLSVFASFSCKKQGFQLYESGDYIQFTRHINDSVMSSFLALPNDDEQPFGLPVELVGHPSDSPRPYKITVVEAETTAKPDSYSIPETFTLGAHKTVDTAWIVLKKTPEISVEPARLVLRIEGTDQLQVGQTSHSAAIVRISNVIAQPTWWNSTVSGRFLGTYSDKKFRLFIEVTGVIELDPTDQELVRTHTIKFKNYLLQEKDAGRTVYEENGSEMTVSLLGG